MHAPLALDVTALNAAAPSGHVFSGVSPSRNPCMIKIGGRYRNDPYTAPVLPAIVHPGAAAGLPMGHVGTNKLVPLPPALLLAQNASNSRMAQRFKKEVALAAAFATPTSPEGVESSLSPSNDGGEAAEELQVPTFAFVRLKHETLVFKTLFPTMSGDFVVVEGDRGINIGCVSHTTTEVPPHPVSCSVLRRASDEEVLQLDAQRQREAAAKHFSQGVADTLQLNIRIVDTEFQADGNKLTVYFSSRRVIDFRRLQRQLFRQFRCRIWLVNWADVHHPGAVGRRPSVTAE